jgi:hypothetical protein
MSLTKRALETQETPADHLARARRSVTIALRTATDGRPDIATLCDIERALNAALREMEQLEVVLTASL